METGTMKVKERIQPEATPLAGVAHATLASAADGLSQLSVWRQILAPGAATPPHRHGCDEVILCLSGRGEVRVAGTTHRFGADSTVLLPKEQLHQLFNVGPAPLELVGIFGSTPVATVLPDGQAIELPWPT
jgi:mannose-6-phosphate isomerase-like protein (cupin superfamily)